MKYYSSQDYLLERKTSEAAAFDLYADLSDVSNIEYDDFGNQYVTIDNTKLVKIPTAMQVCLPKGKVGLVSLRSGFSTENVAVTPTGIGVIDSDYSGVVFVPLIGLTNKSFIVKHGQRIAQMTVVDVYQEPAEKISLSQFIKCHEVKQSDRQGGFGSTGK